MTTTQAEHPFHGCWITDTTGRDFVVRAPDDIDVQALADTEPQWLPARPRPTIRAVVEATTDCPRCAALATHLFLGVHDVTVGEAEPLRCERRECCSCRTTWYEVKG